MLPGLGFTEVVVLAVIALLVVGPRDLPLMLRKLGRFTARLRSMASEFRSGMDELARQAELDELKREVDNLRRANVLTEIDREVRKPVALAPVRAAEPPVEPAPEILESTPEVMLPNPETPLQPESPPSAPASSEPIQAEKAQAAGSRM